jgi:hypothetical protein
VLSSSNVNGIIDSGINNVTNFINNAGTNISSALDNITSGNFDISGLAGVGIGLLANKLGVSRSTVNAVQTGLQIASALSTGGLSLLANPAILNSVAGLLGGSGALSSLTSLTGLLGGSGALSSLTSLTGIPGLGSIGGFLGGGGLAGQTRQAAGFSNTVNRAVVDVAVLKILGSNKIPAPRYTYPSLRALGAANNIAQAQRFLSLLPGSGSSVAQEINTNYTEPYSPGISG